MDTNHWPRRTNSGKLSVSTSSSVWGNNSHTADRSEPPRTKRFGSGGAPDNSGTTSRTHNPFSTLSPLSANAPSTSMPGGGGASSAFGLGSGAFASFGSAGGAAKSPAAAKSPGTANDAAVNVSPRGKDTPAIGDNTSATALAEKGLHPLKSTWIVWYRPPTPKYSDYEKSTVPLASVSSVESFWTVYSYMKRPSQLPTVSDYHIFKKDIRPVWEDESNKRGGKWIVRLRKGVADRYWEDLLLALVGDQFAEASDEVCGAVLSVRSGEDVLSVWTRIDGGRNIKIRETIKRLLAFPPDTNIVWKSHDDSIAQRSAIDQARQEKAQHHHHHHHHHHHNHGDRRRNNTHPDESADKGKTATS